nr:MAG TPA: hypothetical protein [Bacteriophage sp.]
MVYHFLRLSSTKHYQSNNYTILHLHHSNQN